MSRMFRVLTLLVLAALAATPSATAANATGAASPAGAGNAGAPATPAAPAAPVVPSWNNLFGGIGDLVMGVGVNIEAGAYEQQDYAAAARYLEIFHRLNPADKDYAKRLGFALKEIGRYEEAHDLLFQATVDTPEDYVVWWWLSDAQRLLGEYDKAYDSILTSRDLAPENVRQDLQSYVDYTEALGTNVPAWSVFEKHREFARRHEKNRRVRRCIAEYLNALETVPAPQGNRAREEDDRLPRAWVNNQIGIQFNQLKQPDQALEYFWRALRIYEEATSEADVMLVYQNLGVAYRALAETNPDRRVEFFTLAERYWGESSRIAKAQGDVPYIRYTGAGRLYCAANAFGVADPRVVELREANRKELPWQGPLNEFSVATVALAELECRVLEKDHAGARVVGEMAVEFYANSGFLLDNEEALNIYLKLAHTLTLQEHYEKALEQIDAAQAVLDRLREYMDADAFARSTNPTALAGIATARVRAAIAQEDFNAAIRAVEVYRLQARTDLVGNRILNQAYLADYATEKDLIQRGLALLEKDVAAINEKTAPEEAARLQARIATDKARLAWLERGVRFSAEEAVSYRTVPRLGPLERASAWPADTQWVTFVADSYGAFALVCDAQAAWGLALPDLNAESLRTLALTAATGLTVGADAAVPALDALSAKLIAPIRDRLTAKTLYFGVDPVLAGVPCELLRDQGQFLLATHDIAYTPCTSYLIHTAAAPTNGSNAQRLVATNAAALQAALPQAVACVTELCAAHAAESAGVVVISAPADLVPSDPMLASLALNAEGLYDGSLYAAELLGAKPNANAVWLIPSTTPETWNPGQLSGFEEGFLQAGARQVVRPVLPVSEATHAKLLGVASNGTITLEALSAAKREALAATPSDLSPAGVILTGTAN